MIYVSGKNFLFQSILFNNSWALSQSTAVYRQMNLDGPVHFADLWFLIVRWTPRSSELPMGGITEQSTAAGEDTRARSIRVNYLEHGVVCE